MVRRRRGARKARARFLHRGRIIDRVKREPEALVFSSGSAGPAIDPAHDWDVTLSPAFGLGPEGLVEVPGRNVVMAGGRALDIVGSRWHPVQNREVVGIAGEIARAVRGEVSSSGPCGAGRRFWARVALDPPFCLVVTSAHTGSGGLTVTPYAEQDGALVRIGSKPGRSWPHGPTLEARIGGWADTAGWISEWAGGSRRSIDRMSGTRLDPASFVDACSGMFPAREKTKRREENRRDVLDTLAAAWATRSGGSFDSWSALVTVCRWLDVDRPGVPEDRADISLDEGGWVVRAKASAWAAASGARD